MFFLSTNITKIDMKKWKKFAAQLWWAASSYEFPIQSNAKFFESLVYALVVDM